ncbi:AraC family transcriptional regulator [Tetragenococcus halophilus]|uniref:AraC family transcriptional regulator n=1 Tax=Tetragenococcus halophilus TaxID=51669 RepID=A0A3G5FKX6_TETHA|nr:AraC family transcriptional regulator [Tetragenococcus halophilus]AYW51007.1 AraC family transcriptional regulator [Tetragenococcus halophilus]GBD64308.1 hypothetical protein TEHD23766T_1735 [Tetragenococcus halophilus subsp. flandriensis]GMG65574.1 hypothetical protein TEHIT2_07650 [Tetragenococcus halophilus]
MELLNNKLIENITHYDTFSDLTPLHNKTRTSLLISLEHRESISQFLKPKIILGNTGIKNLLYNYSTTELLDIKLRHHTNKKFILPLKASNELKQRGLYLFYCFNKKNVQYDLRGFTECFVAQILEWNKLLLEGDHQVLNLISFMMENLDKDFTLSDFCEMFNISQTKLQKMFQDAVDISPINFFNQLKYQKAKQLVIESDFSIANIAEKLGFENTRYFSVFFSKFERISPLEMRKLYHYLRGGEELMEENISLRFFNQIDRTLYELDQLIQLLNMMKQSNKDIQNEGSSSLEKNFLKIESIYQQYMDQKYGSRSVPRNSYQDIATKISSLLKESEIPLSTKEIYTKLLENNNTQLSYGNFSSNILPRIDNDANFNVERVKRGYWQYRLIN